MLIFDQSRCRQATRLLHDSPCKLVKIGQQRFLRCYLHVGGSVRAYVHLTAGQPVLPGDQAAVLMIPSRVAEDPGKQPEI